MKFIRNEHDLENEMLIARAFRAHQIFTRDFLRFLMSKNNQHLLDNFWDGAGLFDYRCLCITFLDKPPLYIDLYPWGGGTGAATMHTKLPHKQPTIPGVLIPYQPTLFPLLNSTSPFLNRFIFPDWGWDSKDLYDWNDLGTTKAVEREDLIETLEQGFPPKAYLEITTMGVLEGYERMHRIYKPDSLYNKQLN